MTRPARAHFIYLMKQTVCSMKLRCGQGSTHECRCPASTVTQYWPTLGFGCFNRPSGSIEKTAASRVGHHILVCSSEARGFLFGVSNPLGARLRSQFHRFQLRFTGPPFHRQTAKLHRVPSSTASGSASPSNADATPELNCDCSFSSHAMGHRILGPV